MSSLAGALDDFAPSHHPKQAHNYALSSDDIEMNHAVPQYPKNAPEEDEDEEEQDQQDEVMSDLFGNDNDVVEQRHARVPASPSASGPESEQQPSPEREPRHALEYDEEEAAPEVAVEVKEAKVSFPNLPVPKSSDGDNWVIRVPNFVKVESKPFHPDTYVGPEEDELLPGDSAREKSNTIKLKVENMLRWRWKKDVNGQDVKESNSRIIRWSDGTLSLRLGKELFDITQTIDNSGSVTRSSIGGSQTQSQTQTQPEFSENPAKSEGLTYLVAQHKRSQVLQSEAVITGHMSLRPTSMSSETHRMLVRSVEQKHKQVARLKLAPDPSIDPEREKMELLKQSAKKSKRKTNDNDGMGSGKRRRNYRRSADHDVTWSDDDDEGGGYGGGSDEDDVESMGASPRKAKRKTGEEKREEDYQADDFVVPDDTDDDVEGGGGRSRKPAREGSEDDLDRMEANLEKQAAAQKKGRGGDTKKPKGRNADHDEDSDEGDEGDMDVESEEDDEDFKVRRVTSKRAIAFDDEEE